MKNLLFTFLFFTLSTMVFSQETKNTEISKTLINQFQKSEYSKIVELFDGKMKSALPAEKLKLVWEDLNIKCGKYQKFSEITGAKYQEYDIVYVLCHFQNVNLKMKAVFNAQNQVAGLFFIPENQQ